MNVNKVITILNWYDQYGDVLRYNAENRSWIESIFQIKDFNTGFDTIHLSPKTFFELVQLVAIYNKALPSRYKEELREYFSCDFLVLKSTPDNVLLFTKKGILVTIAAR